MIDQNSNNPYLYYAFIMFVFILIIQAGSGPHMDFEVMKKTDDLIDSISISTTERENLDIIGLNNANKFKYKLDMNGLPEIDGSYILTYTRNGKRETEYFGYYTNGCPINDGYRIIITDDESIITEY